MTTRWWQWATTQNQWCWDPLTFPRLLHQKSNLLNLNLTSFSTTFKVLLLAKNLNHYLWIRSLIICRTQHQILNLPFRALCSSTKPTTHTHPHFSPTRSSYYSHTWIHVFLHIHTDAKIVPRLYICSCSSGMFANPDGHPSFQAPLKYLEIFLRQNSSKGVYKPRVLLVFMNTLSIVPCRKFVKCGLEKRILTKHPQLQHSKVAPLMVLYMNLDIFRINVC